MQVSYASHCWSGNPGKQYANTRHNVGFKAADFISDRLSLSPFSNNSKFKGQIAIGEAFGDKITLLKPETYMNLSGEAVGAISHYYKIPIEKIIVIHDDIDLKLGDMRLKRGGGHGGHNGIESIDSHLGKDYWRIRIGVDRPNNKDEVPDYVLEDFSKKDMLFIDEVLSDIIKSIEEILK